MARIVQITPNVHELEYNRAGWRIVANGDKLVIWRLWGEQWKEAGDMREAHGLLRFYRWALRTGKNELPVMFALADGKEVE